MANRYNPPQKRPPHSAANYFTPLNLTSNTNAGVSANASASHVTTSTALSPIPAREQGHVANIHGPYTHPSSEPHTTLQPQARASPSRSLALSMHSPSHLRGDSTPYMPIQAPNMTSPSGTTPNQQITTLPYRTSRPQSTGLPNILVSQPTWPAPSPRAQRPLSSQLTPTSANAMSSTQKQPKPSVKHLTCFFWSEFGHCQWSSEECLYAHWYTGKVASAPVQVEVGKPAVAGRNAESAKPRYEEWRPSTEKASIEGPTPTSASSSHPHGTLAPLPFPAPPDAVRKGTAADPEAPVALLVDAVATLSAALCQQQARVVGMKEALVEHCQAMLSLAQAMDARGLPIEAFVDRSMVFVDSVAEHGRAAEELGALLGRVRARLEGAGLRGVARTE